jgi:pimeloyl-ACP methyl ester carboxylesterase
MAAIDRTLTTPTTGIELHYRDWGGAGQPIVLLHGLASSARIWDLVAPRLTRSGRVIAVDQRGHGLSAKPDGGYDYTSIVADVAGVVQALDLAPPVVVGHSWGASVALAYAAATPACPGAVLVDGGIMDMQARPGGSWEETARALAPPDLSHLRLADLVSYMGRGPLKTLDESFRIAFFHSLMEEQPDETIRPRLTRDRHLAILRAMWEQRPGPLLDQARCPLLIVLAQPPDSREDDPFQVAKRQGLAAVAARPATETHLLPDTIHDIPLHRPDTLANLILNWMDSLSLAGRGLG